MNSTAMFYDERQLKRVSVGTALAIALHIALLIWLMSSPLVTKMANMDVLSVPTNVSIRFTSPVPEVKATPPVQQAAPIKKIKPKPVVKKVTPKPVVKAKATPKVTQEVAKPVKEVQVADAPSPQPQKPTPQTIPEVSEGDAFIHKETPKYPKRAERMRHEANVSLRVLLSETGKRLEIKTLNPSKYASLHRAAIKALKKSTFRPYILNGQPVKSQVQVTYIFTVNN